MTGDTDRPAPSFASNQQLSEKMRAKDILHAFWDGWMVGWMVARLGTGACCIMLFLTLTRYNTTVRFSRDGFQGISYLKLNGNLTQTLPKFQARMVDMRKIVCPQRNWEPDSLQGQHRVKWHQYC